MTEKSENIDKIKTILWEMHDKKQIDFDNFKIILQALDRVEKYGK